ncbi:MAG: Na+/H+ antiporter NhaA [Methyloceanibacter sp.]
MSPKPPGRGTFQRFIQSEAAGGVVLMGSTALALAVANTFLGPAYEEALHVRLAGLDVLHWINDGLMALFFLLVGLEIKRELVEGELNSWARRALPLLAALGGVLIPALIFVAVNWQTPETLRGWAIPTATDIAFALGVLSLFGPRVAHSLKVFLTSLAIIDDLGAIVIIATFYASDLSVVALALAGATAAVLYGLNAFGVIRLAPYLLLGLLLWGAMLSSGIHASLAGVVLAMTIPIGASSKTAGAHSPLHSLERALSPWVAFLVLPVFGFANVGVSLAATGVASLISPLSLGVIGGLLLGKQTGVLASVFLAKRIGVGALPAGANWRQIYGVALLCGIGFTMSLFIGLLAFSDPEREAATKLAVLVGSSLSALVGAAVLLRGVPTAQTRTGCDK